MLFDGMSELSYEQDIHAGSCASTNSYDTGMRANYNDIVNPHPGQRNLGAGKPVRVRFTITSSFGGGAGTYLQVSLQDSADNTTFSGMAGGATEQIPVAALIAGYGFDVYVPLQCRQYLQAFYQMDAAFSQGAISADVVVDSQSARVF